MSGGLSVVFHLFIAVKNIGRVAASAPYIRLKGASFIPAEAPPHSPAYRVGADGFQGFYAGGGTLVHVGDELALCAVTSGVLFATNAQTTLQAAASRARLSRDESEFLITPDAMSYMGIRSDQLLQLEVKWGAQNALAQTRDFSPGKLDMFEGQI